MSEIYFKDYTGGYSNSVAYYCGKEDCITCKYSYGRIIFTDKSQHMFCQRPTQDCEYTPLNRVNLKRVVDFERKPNGEVQAIVAGEEDNELED